MGHTVRMADRLAIFRAAPVSVGVAVALIAVLNMVGMKRPTDQSQLKRERRWMTEINRSIDS